MKAARQQASQRLPSPSSRSFCGDRKAATKVSVIQGGSRLEACASVRQAMRLTIQTAGPTLSGKARGTCNGKPPSMCGTLLKYLRVA